MFSEAHELLDKIDPVSTDAEVDGSWIDVKKFHRLVAKFQVGAIASTGTLTFQVRQATSAAGAGAKALKATAAIDDTGDNKVHWLEIRGEEFDVNDGFHYARIEAVAATAASIVSGELLGIVGRYSRQTNHADLTVVE